MSNILDAYPAKSPKNNNNKETYSRVVHTAPWAVVRFELLITVFSIPLTIKEIIIQKLKLKITTRP